MSLSPGKSYHQILKSSFVVGGASFINIVLGIVRTKVLALLLGPTGVGILGIYNSVVQTAGALMGLGIGRSAVRQIAEASGTGLPNRCAKSVAGTLRWSLILALTGGAVMFFSREAISKFMFHSVEQATDIGWLGLAVFCGILSAGQIGVIQGTRNVRFLANQSVVGALFGTLVGLPIIYFRGRAGVVWVVLAVGLAGLGSSWLYMRKVTLSKTRLTWQDFWTEGRSLIGLGVILMMTGLLSTGTLLVVRILLNRQMGEAATGYFQAAFGVSVVYLDFILQAMGADFYPRLAAAAHDHDLCNRSVNEQLEIALLMAGPLILAMLAFAPVVIYLLYAKGFEPACEILRWQILGSLFKVTAWPVGFILLAKNQGWKFFVCELLWNVTYLGIILLGIRSFGLVILGTGFAAAYALLLCWVLLLGARVTGFSLNGVNRRLVGTFFAAAVLIFLLNRFANPGAHYVLSSMIVLVCGYWSLTKLYWVVGREKLSAIRCKIISRFSS
jgi:PST family polysaccharide transporter